MKPRDRAGGTDHQHQFAEMGHEMRQRTDRRSHGEQSEKAQRAEPTRDSRSERQQPDDIDEQVRQAGVEEGVADECPDLRPEPARQHFARRNGRKRRRVVANRNKSEPQHEAQVVLIREQEHAPQVNENEYRNQPHQRGRDVEDGF
jgi:hypothetical protein